MPTAFVIAGLLAGVLTWPVSGQTPRSVWDGVYTDEQAVRGQATYQRQCASCHGDNLLGDGLLPALAGNAFTVRWQNGAVADLFAQVQSTMPIFQPQSLSDEAYADVVAYLLKVNKYPAGRQALIGRSETLKQVAFRKDGVIRQNRAGATAPATSLASEGFYTAAQAERGRTRFRTMCSGCHSADAAATTSKEPDTLRPNGRIPIGGRTLPKWQNVRNYFDKIRRTMPEGNPKTISAPAAVDVVAYVLQQNGFPAGTEELKDNNNMMRSIMFNEPGFERLFNGRSLDGWQFLIGNYCGHPSAPPCRTDAGSTFKVQDNLLVTTGQPMGIGYTTKKFLNFTLRLDYRYPRPSDMDSEERNWGDTGYFLFLNDFGAIWPAKRLELQGGPDTVLLNVSGTTPAKAVVDADARARAVKPTGEWNAIEIVSKNGTVTASLNGQLVATITNHGYTEPGSFGLQAESSEVHFRNIRVRPE